MAPPKLIIFQLKSLDGPKMTPPKWIIFGLQYGRNSFWWADFTGNRTWRRVGVSGAGMRVFGGRITQGLWAVLSLYLGGVWGQPTARRWGGVQNLGWVSGGDARLRDSFFKRKTHLFLKIFSCGAVEPHPTPIPRASYAR